MKTVLGIILNKDRVSNEALRTRVEHNGCPALFVVMGGVLLSEENGYA